MASSENVRVCVRCRPLSESEEQNNCLVVVKVCYHLWHVFLKVNEETATVSLRHPNRGEGGPPKSFIFDHTFGFESKQLDIYNKVARPVVEQIFGGYNGMPVHHYLALIFRNNFRLWSDWNWQDLYYGWDTYGSRVKRNNTKLICTYIWSHRKCGF